MSDYLECAWCREIFEADELVKEVDLGYLCEHCIRALESRGEHLEIEIN